MVQVRLEDDWRVIQVDIDTHSSSSDVYAALKQLLKSSHKQSHIVCDGVVLTEENACNLIKAGSVVQIRAGPVPVESSTGASSLPPLVSVQSSSLSRASGKGSAGAPRRGASTGQLRLEGSQGQGSFWLPSQHLGPVGLHGVKGTYGSRGPNKGGRPGGTGADFGATRGSGGGGAKGYYPDPASVTAASLGISVPGMDAAVAEELALDDLSMWMDSYQSEVLSFSSSALNAELRYEEVLRSTAALGSPNAVRTRVVCQLLDAVVMRFGRFQRITQRLLHDVFASVFVDPDAPDAVPYFLRYARVQIQLTELRGKHDLLLKDLEGEEGRSRNRWAYINRTLANMFNGQLVAAFRQWRLRVEENMANRDLIQRMIVKWRKQDLLKALFQWKQNSSMAKQERSDAAVDELRAVNNELRQRLERTEAERDIANMEINRLNNELAAMQLRLTVSEDRKVELGQQLEAAEEEVVTYKAYKTVAVEYRQTLAGVVASNAMTQKTALEARRSADAGPMHNPGEEDIMAVDPVDKIMRWFNNHLVKLGQESITNLSTDLKDGKELAVLMHVGNPAAVPIDKILNEVDPSRVARFAVEKAEELFGFPPGCVEPTDIVNVDPAANLALVAWMMNYHHGMDRVGVPEDVLAECDNVVAAATMATDRPIEDEVGTGGVPMPMSYNIMEAVNKADAAVRALTAKRDVGEKHFKQYSTDVMRFALQVLIQKSKGVEVEIKDDRKSAERAQMVKLDADKLKDIVPDEGERGFAVDELERVLGSAFDELRKIYKYYASGGNMSNPEFWKLVKDAKIPTKELFGGKIDLIFVAANGPGAVGEVVDRELDPGEFMEALVRMAHVREKGRNLAEKTKSLIQNQILPNACKSESEQFRKALADKDVVFVMDKYRDALRAIFKKYSGADKSTGAAAQAAGSMNFKEIIEMLKACNLLGNGIDQHDLDIIFGAVQDSDGNDGDDAGDENEMVFPEFLEMMCTIGIYRNPNPYMPLARRLENFFGNDLVKPLQSKIKGLKLP